MKGKIYKNVLVMPGTKMYELLESKNPEDQKKAKRLYEFCFKAEACFYSNPEYANLRAQFKDIL